MNDLKLSGTVNTPEINFRSTGELIIRGRSLPEDVAGFYKPVIQWIRQNMTETISLEIEVDYMNSSSTKKLLELFKIIEKSETVKNFYINWLYDADDEDSLEKGLLMEEILEKAIFRYQVTHPAEC